MPEAFDLAAVGPLAVRLNGPGLIWHQGRRLDDNAITPIYVAAELERHDGAMLRAATALPARREARRALVFHGWGVQVYGHFLIEMLPKLLLAARFPALFGDLAPVLDRAMSPWLIDILTAHLGIDEGRAIWFDSRAEQLDLDAATILPLLTRRGGYHPLAGTLIENFAARIAVPPADPMPRLFVARGDFANPAAPRRRLLNEAELAEIAAREFGFAVVHPETLDFAAQAGLFAQARAVLGQAGSGMHNALFSPAGAAIGMIRFPAPDQSAIAALRRQRIAYLTEGVHEPAPGEYIVDHDRFRHFVEALLHSWPAMRSVSASSTPVSTKASISPA